MEDVKQTLFDNGASEQQVQELLEEIEAETRALFDDYEITITNQNTITIIQKTFLQLLIEIGQSEDKTIQTEIEKSLQTFNENRGRSDVIYTASTARHKTSNTDLEKIGGAILARNYGDY